jgi:two-component system chemotaxis response regulator CheB
MAIQRVVVIGASSGGIEAMKTIARSLPADFPAPVCVVIHTAADSIGMLGGILDRAGPLPAKMAVTGDRLQPGHIYVAPPDHHLLIEPGVLRLTRGPKENRFRPAVDPLFRSVAQVYGPSAVGVVLTGHLDDGTAGLWTIKQLGGVAIVQDPADAMFPEMPSSAVRHVNVDYSVPLADLAPLLVAVVSSPVDERRSVMSPEKREQMDIEVKIAGEHNPLDVNIGKIAEPSPFACPECHGVLLRLKGVEPLRFRCHTGHGYSAPGLVAAVSDSIDEALWSAVRALHEGGMLLQHLGEHLISGDRAAADALAAQAGEARRQAEIVREVVTERRRLTTSDA